jgi:hypothetical protein
MSSSRYVTHPLERDWSRPTPPSGGASAPAHCEATESVCLPSQRGHVVTGSCANFVRPGAGERPRRGENTDEPLEDVAWNTLRTAAVESSSTEIASGALRSRSCRTLRQLRSRGAITPRGSPKSMSSWPTRPLFTPLVCRSVWPSPGSGATSHASGRTRTLGPATNRNRRHLGMAFCSPPTGVIATLV